MLGSAMQKPRRDGRGFFFSISIIRDWMIKTCQVLLTLLRLFCLSYKLLLGLGLDKRRMSCRTGPLRAERVLTHLFILSG